MKRLILALALLCASAFSATSEGGDNRINIKPANGAVGSIRFFELIGNGTNYVELKCQPSLASNLILVLPGTNGTTGQALTTDGAGNLSWTTISGGGGSTNASDLTSGTLDDARLSANVPLPASRIMLRRSQLVTCVLNTLMAQIRVIGR